MSQRAGSRTLVALQPIAFPIWNTPASASTNASSSSSSSTLSVPMDTMDASANANLPANYQPMVPAANNGGNHAVGGNHPHPPIPRGSSEPGSYFLSTLAPLQISSPSPSGYGFGSFCTMPSPSPPPTVHIDAMALPSPVPNHTPVPAMSPYAELAFFDWNKKPSANGKDGKD